jgi:hypothetical protein
MEFLLTVHSLCTRNCTAKQLRLYYRYCFVIYNLVDLFVLQKYGDFVGFPFMVDTRSPEPM